MDAGASILRPACAVVNLDASASLWFDRGMMNVDNDTVAVWTGLMSVSQAFLERIDQALKAASLPPLSWYDALLEIERAGPAGIRPFALKETLLMPQYGTSRLLGRIEKAGLISRSACEGDGRGQVVQITETGRWTRRQMWPVYARQLEELIGARLDASERQHLVDLVAKLSFRKEPNTTSS